MKNAEINTRQIILRQAKISFFIWVLPFICQAQDTLTKSSPVKVHGYVKDMQSAFFTNNAKSLVTGNFIHNRVNLKWNISDRLYLRAEVRNRLYYGEQVKTTPFFGKYVDRDNGLLHLSANVIEDTSIVLNTMLDRALLNWSNKKWDITIGRQRVNWGVNLVWNPNDIFNALNYFDFDYEERPGSDAIRVQYATGNFSSIELACKISDKGKEQVGAVMYKTNYKKYDLQQMAGIYFEDLVIGTGWAGNLMNNGFKGEVSYFHPYKKMMTHNGVLSGSVSIDRSFKNNYFAVLSYLYNSEGKGALHQMTELTGAVLSAKKLMPFKHSFFGQVSKSFTPLINGNMAGMYSPESNTIIFLPSVDVSVSKDWDLTLVGQSFFSEISGSFRTLGNSIYLRLRWSY